MFVRFSSTSLLLLMLCGVGCSGSAVSDRSLPATQPAAVSDDDPGDPDDRLTGRWLAEGVPTDAGPMELRLKFEEDGDALVVAISEMPFLGEVKRVDTKYTIKDSAIHCEADDRVMPYTFDGDHVLLLTYKPDRVVRFNRTAEEDLEGAVHSVPR